MALNGQQDPNLSVVRVGSTRGEIEMQLGKPEKSISNVDGTRIDSYKYQTGDVPSAGRAAGYAVLDIFSFFLWEIVGVPIEASQGTNFKCAVTYDKGDKVLAIN